MDDADFIRYLKLADRIGPAIRSRLIAAGVTSLNALDSITDDDLLAIDGIGKGIVEKLRQFAEWCHKREEQYQGWEAALRAS